jgi:hypothetical protein
MVVINKYYCRLGNQLFQYAFARILAEHFGYAMEVPPLLNLTNKLEGKRIESPVEIVKESGVRLEIPINSNAVLSNTTPRKIVLDGYFQQASIYEPHRDKIREWFKESLPPIESNSFVVHLRFGDYEKLGWTLPVSYYAEAAKRAQTVIGDTPCYIVTDDVRSLTPYISAMECLSPIVKAHEDAITSLRRIIGAKYIICANSSFSWWGAFLSNAKKIWMPHNWQPWGISQTGDQYFKRGEVSPVDLRVYLPEFEIIDCGVK